MCDYPCPSASVCHKGLSIYFFIKGAWINDQWRWHIQPHFHTREWIRPKMLNLWLPWIQSHHCWLGANQAGFVRVFSGINSEITTNPSHPFRKRSCFYQANLVIRHRRNSVKYATWTITLMKWPSSLIPNTLYVLLVWDRLLIKK